MRERRRRASERLIEQDLLRRVRDVIVAADDMRDPHVDVVDDDREVVGGLGVGAQDDEVFDHRVREFDRAVHQVGEAGLALRHLEADRARRSGGLTLLRSARPSARSRSGRRSSRRPQLRPPVASPAASRACSSSSRRCRSPPGAPTHSRYFSSRCDWKYGACGPPISGPSSQSRPSQRRPSTMPETISHDERSVSVSSIRSTNVPPCRRA